MCCGSSAVGSGRSTTIASIVSFSNRRSRTLAPAITTPSGPPWPSTTIDFLVPSLPRSVGFLPVFFPPEPGLAQPSIRALPLPIHRTQLVALRDEGRPDPFHDTAGAPALEPIVDRALGAELAGELLPLAAGAHPEDDPVEGGTPVGGPPAGRLLGPEFPEDGEDLLPQGVRDLPDRLQWFGLRFPPGLAFGLGHPGTLLSVSPSQSV